jgi:hypothetical protein
MQAIPDGVLLLYTANTRPYATRVYSTTARDFEPDPVLQPNDVAFKPMAPLQTSPFQVDTTLE